MASVRGGGLGSRGEEEEEEEAGGFCQNFQIMALESGRGESETEAETGAGKSYNFTRIQLRPATPLTFIGLLSRLQSGGKN